MNAFFRNNLNGILGTIVFHLLIIAAFMALELSTANRDHLSAIMIDIDLMEQLDMADDQIQPDPVMTENQYWEHVLRRNIAVSESNDRPVPDQFKNMNASQQQELEDRLSEILQQANQGNLPDFPDQPEITMQEPLREEIQDVDVEPEPYQGPSNIFYNLPGRQAIWLPVPIYRCPDKGIVTVLITVNQLGYVIQAAVREKASGYNQECLQDAAVDAAMKARFNHSQSFPQRQSGTITFHFQPQRRR